MHEQCNIYIVLNLHSFMVSFKDHNIFKPQIINSFNCQGKKNEWDDNHLVAVEKQ